VDTQCKKLVAPVNEFISSKCDLLIYYSQFSSSLGAVYIDFKFNVDFLHTNDDENTTAVPIKDFRFDSDTRDATIYDISSDRDTLDSDTVSIQI